jgi:hypothetical protein
MPARSATLSDQGNNGDLLFRILDTNGDGTGNKVANGNYSGAAEDFYIQPAQGETFVILHLGVVIHDSGTFGSDDYGAILSGLTNGVQVLVTDSGGSTILDLCDGVNVKTNYEWGRFCDDVQLPTFGGAGVMFVRCKLFEAGRTIVLKDQERLIVRLNDDLTGLSGHQFSIQGYKATIGRTVPGRTSQIIP